MKILTSKEITEDVSYSVCLGFVGYEDEEQGYLGSFLTSFESKTESIVDGDAILVYTIEYHGVCYFKFVSAVKPELGPLYVPFNVQDRDDACFGDELRDMHEFKREYITKFDALFHRTGVTVTASVPPNHIVISAEEIIDAEHFPLDN